MPYIDKKTRTYFDPIITQLNIVSEGQLNYVLTKIIHEYILTRGPLNYAIINEVIGAIEGAKLEFYRKVAGPYEDKKIEINGSISELDE